jgi:SAM-dependent methyltransferase
VTAPEDATRAAYDTVAADYAALFRDELRSNVFDRAVLGAFAELVLADGGGRVADLGCGPGRITGHLHELGLDVSGIDLSPGMIAVAREALPHVPFAVGSMLALDLADGALAAAVAWYSVIHTAPERQPALFRELARVLRPGGHLVVAFQVGDERVHLDHVYGHDVSFDVYRLGPDDVADRLAGAGFEVTARLVREPVGPEPQPQAYLIARRR